MVAGERLPENNSHGPDVRTERRFLAGEPLRRDVCERAGDVSCRGQRLCLGELGEAEVQELHRDLRGVGDEDVRRLYVAMDDPVTVRVREPIEDLRRDLEHGGVVQLPCPEPIAQRPSGHVLVGDVDVLLVAGERVGAQAMRVA